MRPRGTALALGERTPLHAVASSPTSPSMRGTDRSGRVCPAPSASAVTRGGSVVGEHAVRFIGTEEEPPHDRLRLPRRDLSRWCRGCRAQTARSAGLRPRAAATRSPSAPARSRTANSRMNTLTPTLMLRKATNFMASPWRVDRADDERVPCSTQARQVARSRSPMSSPASCPGGDRVLGHAITQIAMRVSAARPIRLRPAPAGRPAPPGLRSIRSKAPTETTARCSRTPCSFSLLGGQVHGVLDLDATEQIAQAIAHRAYSLPRSRNELPFSRGRTTRRRHPRRRRARRRRRRREARRRLAAQADLRADGVRAEMSTSAVAGDPPWATAAPPTEFGRPPASWPTASCGWLGTCCLAGFAR